MLSNLSKFTILTVESLGATMQAVAPLCQSQPSVPLPDVTENPQWYGEIFFRYSSASTIFTANFGHFFHAKVHLWSIAHDIAYQSYKVLGGDASLSAGQVSELYTQLWSWNHNLPACLQPDRIVTPYEIQLQ